MKLSAASAAFALLLLLAVPVVSAEKFQSGSYTIDGSAAGNFGGSMSATSYKMVSAGGEAIIGDGAAGSYKLGQGYVAQLEKSLELAILPSNIAAYYGFDENYGTRIYDSSVNNAHAPLTGGPTWVTGKIGTGLQFNGSSQFMSIPSTAENNIETVTVSAWIKTNQVPSTNTPIVQKWGGSGAYPYTLRLNSGGTVSFLASDGTNTPTATSSTTVNNGAWHHVAGVRTDGGQIKVIVDGGVPNSVTDTTTGLTTNAATVGVAKRDNGTDYFSGTIDEVKIFNAALTDKAVTHEYAAGNAGLPSSQTFADLATLSQTVGTVAVVQTDAPGYTLGISQDQNLTSGANSIPAIGGSIATPVAWAEGTTNGLGFTLTGGTGIDSKWGAGPNYNYAAIPGVTTTFHARTGYSGGVKDVITIQYRVDVPVNQTAGSYKNQVTYTATMQP